MKHPIAEHQDHYAAWGRLLALVRGEDPGPADDVTWAWCVKLARQVGVAAYLHARLRGDARLDRLPASCREELATSYRHGAMRNTRLYHALRQLLGALADAAIPATVLKGVYLAKVVYGNIAVRAMSDIDLLVPTKRLLEAAALVRDLGYTPRYPMPAYVTEALHQLPEFMRPDGAVVELHGTAGFLHLHPTLPADQFAAMQARAIDLTIDSYAVTALAPADLVLHLCVHTAIGHSYRVDLRPYLDLREVIRHAGDALDWAMVLRLADALDVTPVVCLTLHAARQWVGAAVPDAVIARLDPALRDPGVLHELRWRVLSAPHPTYPLTWYRRACPDETLLLISLDAWYGRRGRTFKTRPLVNALRRLSLGTLGRRYARLLAHALRGDVAVTSSIRHSITLDRLIAAHDPVPHMPPMTPPGPPAGGHGGLVE